MRPWVQEASKGLDQLVNEFSVCLHAITRVLPYGVCYKLCFDVRMITRQIRTENTARQLWISGCPNKLNTENLQVHTNLCISIILHKHDQLAKYHPVHWLR